MPPVESFSAVSYGPTTSSVSVYYFLFNLGNLNEVAITIKFCCCIYSAHIQTKTSFQAQISHRTKEKYSAASQKRMMYTRSEYTYT